MRYIDLIERDYPSVSDLAVARICPCDMLADAKSMCDGMEPPVVSAEICRRCWEQEAKE